LTASDGTGLRLVNVDVLAVHESPLAFTELHLAFDNPNERTIEGRFRMVLPQRAKIARLAMKVGDAYQEAEVVERQAARVAYEDALHRKRDPLLLEQAGGNSIEARVFPIAPHERKQIIVAYSEAILEATGHVLPLRGLPVLDRLSVKAYDGAGGKLGEDFERTNYAPDAELRILSRSVAGPALVRSGNLAVLRFTPVEDATPEALGATLLLVDTSASQAKALEQTSGRLAEVLRALATDESGPLVLAAFDQEVQVLSQGTFASAAGTVAERLRERRALGASNLSAALAYAAEPMQGRALQRIVLVTDGLGTAGDRELPALRAAVLAAGQAGVKRLDVIAPGESARDAKTLSQLVASGLPRNGAVIDADRDARTIAWKLRSRVERDVPLRVDGASFVWPAVLRSVQAGDEVVVAAELSAQRAVRLSAGDRVMKLPEPTSGTQALLGRYHAEARIDALLEREAIEGRNSELTREIIELSRNERVLSPYTSLLVLETDADYARFGIPRRAPGAYLGVRDGRLTRGNSPALASETRGRRSFEPGGIEDNFGERGLGLRELGEGASGFGRGIGLGAVGTLAPSMGDGSRQGSGATRNLRTIRQGLLQISGRMSPEAIQRIVRRNFGRLRLCYAAALAKRPNLQGRVVMRFTIDRTGALERPVRLAPSFAIPTLDDCIIKAMSKLSFPAPDGAPVTVAYPLLFGIEESLPKSGGLSSPAPIRREAPPPAATYDGQLGEITTLLAHKRNAAALKQALEWTAQEPSETLAYFALGRVYASLGRPRDAARAYGSLIDLYAARADMRRYAGNLLESLPDAIGLDLAIDTYRAARNDRADHPSSHRLLALALAKRERYGEAFDVLLAALSRGPRSDRFQGVERVLRDDLALAGALWQAHEPAARETVRERLDAARVEPLHGPSVRFVLTWETDANDVDLHLYDAAENHAWYENPRLPSGGELYADITTGYGPECFNIPLSGQPAEYRLRAHYYSRGPMGYGMGKLEIIEFDGRGKARFEERPYLVTQDRGYVDLGHFRTGRAWK
jgi:tetratricopeptide (TPR) repeat protein